MALVVCPSSLYANFLYSQPCRAIGDDFVKFNIEIDSTSLIQGSVFNFKVTAYEDQTCKTPYLKFDQYFTVESLRSEKINLKTLKVTYTSLSDEVSEALRLINYCDIPDWQTGREISVTGKVCDDYQQLNKNDVFYQILHLNTDSLMFGETTDIYDGRSQNKRPIHFDSSNYPLGD